MLWEFCSENASRIAQGAYHGSMVLFAVSYALKDILWLRLLAVIAGLAGLPFFFFCTGEVMWEAVFWNSLFTAIHAIRLGMLLYERRPVHLGEEERRLHTLVFRGLAASDMARLLSIAEWHDAPAGTRIVERGRDIEGLLLIYSGVADVMNDGQKFAESRDGQCIGEMSFITGLPPSADVYAHTQVRYVRLPKPELDDLMSRHDRIREVVHSVLGFDMAEKLTARSRLDASEPIPVQV